MFYVRYFHRFVNNICCIPLLNIKYKNDVFFLRSLHTGTPGVFLSIHKNKGFDMCIHLLLQWRHNGRNGVSDHQPHDCLLNRLFKRWSKKTPKFHVTGRCAGNSPEPGEFPHKEPVTRKMFPFDDAIMYLCWEVCTHPLQRQLNQPTVENMSYNSNWIPLSHGT